MLTMGSAELKAVVDSERNQGRAPDMGWLDHDRLGFNYRLTDIACALGLAQLERLDGMLADRARVASWYREALSGREGLELPCEDAGDVRGWFVFVVQLPHGAGRDDTIRALGERGIQSKPYLPAIHLMSFYRERFGHREGEFPICEDVAARSIALPFFPEMTEGQVAEVAESLDGALQRLEVADEARTAQRARGPIVRRVADLALDEAGSGVQRPRGRVLEAGVEREPVQAGLPRLLGGVLEQSLRDAAAAPVRRRPRARRRSRHRAADAARRAGGPQVPERLRPAPRRQVRERHPDEPAREAVAVRDGEAGDEPDDLVVGHGDAAAARSSRRARARAKSASSSASARCSLPA